MVSKRAHLILITIILTILLVPTLLPSANAAGITVNVSRDSVSILMNLQLVENLTTSLPSLNVVQDQSSPILQPIQKGFESMVPRAHIDMLTLHALTAEINNRTGLWIFQENYTITVSGVTDNTGGRVIADLAFLSSRNNQSIPVSGVELNNVGPSYLVQGFQRFPPDSKTRYFAGTGEYTLPLIPQQYTSSFSLLDFSLVPPVWRWSGGYQPFQPSTTWNLQPRTLPYNVTVGVGLTTENTYLKEYTAFLDYSLQIVAPPRAQTDGTRIVFDIPTTAETTMPIIIVVSLVTAFTTLFWDRRVSKSTRPVRVRKR